MYKELTKFKKNNSFQFSSSDDLELVCNAPSDGSGVFLVFEIKEESKELLMVGSTGTVQNDGSLKIKSGGLFDKIVNGHQFAKTARKYTWKTQLEKENISAIEVYWYDTFNDKIKVIPTFVEAQILQIYFKENGTLPLWNVAF